ncbi:MAG: type II toxin-antitoxin system HicA family toxin [Candidatus Eremiobacteraeota bacterium]|nr:type II toxin-antitoxin system HicA family toxin [Candidatus Eremiobacteraeota bacterium]
MAGTMREHNRRAVVRLLLSFGFRSLGGPHEKFVHSNGRLTVVPRQTTISAGACRKIVRQVGISPQRFDRMVRR